MSAKTQDIVLRVFMEQTGNVWEAICIDLDIAAQGSSREETTNLIEGMILSYLEAMKDHSPEDRKRFLNRKSPLSVRVAWTFRFLSSSIFTNSHGGDKVGLLFHHNCPA